MLTSRRDRERKEGQRDNETGGEAHRGGKVTCFQIDQSAAGGDINKEVSETCCLITSEGRKSGLHAGIYSPSISLKLV